MKKVEEFLLPYFAKVPFSLPESWRGNIVRFLPVLCTVSGALLGLITALLILLSVVLSLFIVIFFTMSVPQLIITLAVFCIETVLLFKAAPLLKARRKEGWNILFMLTFIGAALGIIRLSGLGDAILVALLLAFGLYMLFQIRPYYTHQAQISHK